MFFDGITTPEMDLYTYLATNVLNTFTEIFGLRNHHVDVLVAVGGVIFAVAIVMNTLGLGLGLYTTLFKTVHGLEYFHDPRGVTAPGLSLFGMFLLLEEQLGGSANCLGLCKRMLNTLYLADKLWWLSMCKYWSLCVGLL